MPYAPDRPLVGLRLRVEVGNDPDAEDPLTWGRYRLVSFSCRHNRYEDHRKYREYCAEGSRWRPAVRRRLERGTAFLLDYFEHGLGRWSLTGEGPQCRWDNAVGAGLLFDNQRGRLTPDERRERARAFLEDYTDWCNGDVYCFDVEDEAGAMVDSCGSIYGTDRLLELIVESVDFAEVEISGPFRYLQGRFEERRKKPVLSA